MKDIIEDANTKAHQLGLLRNIERNMVKAQRQRETNVKIVMDYITAHTSKGGRTSAGEYCKWLGVDPDGKTFN